MKLYGIKRGAVLLLWVLLLSCNDEDLWEEQYGVGDRICFGVSSGETSEAKTRSVTDFVLRAADSADLLCMTAEVAEGIDEKITRGVSVSLASFYDRFHVLAYWKKNGTLVDQQFYMDDDASKKGAVWSSTNVYYWPGRIHALQFYAWAPTDAGLVAPKTPSEDRMLSYRVPAEAPQQKDLVVASTTEFAGDSNQTVPLTFRHVCTAVRFAVGRQMQPGSIKSVALQGVKYQGSYDMAGRVWILDAATTDFAQTLNFPTTGTEAAGDAITPAGGTFMMLPQQLPADARVEVVFVNAEGVERTLTASVGNTEWRMATTITYKLSVSPEGELDFVTCPRTQDAHYEICPITIRCDARLGSKGGWTLTSDDPQHVTFVEQGKFVNPDIEALVKAGYWLEEHHGTSTLKSSSTGDVTVYVFLRENVTEADRKITLSLSSAQGVQEAKTFSFLQYCPAWNNGIGVERIQDADEPWGFNWSEVNFKYTFGKGFASVLINIYIRLFVDSPCVTDKGWGVFSDTEVIFDLSKMKKLTTAKDPDNGNQNTWDLYTYDGINNILDLITMIKSWGGKLESNAHLPQTSNFAGRACGLKNKYLLQQENHSGHTVYRPVLNRADLLWYLPARDEMPLLQDNLSGDYWTSTSITDPGTTAWKYTAGGTASPEDRGTVLHVRAVRAKPII